MNLYNEILNLIQSKREGTYWDFKANPHENNASLLHDILSLANCNYNGDRFLIIGVSDPDKGCEIVGLEKQQINRKNQPGFVDLLRTKKFGGDLRPEIELSTFIVDEKEIDVIKVLNKPNKPYYLTEDFQDKGKRVRANYIYTRIQDTNTPIDKSADIYHVEKMWKERFGIDMSPLNRMKYLLQKPHEWFKDLGNKSYSYHKQFPEFRIEFSELEKIHESYSFLYTNPNSYLGTATFKFHSTTLFELEYLTVDEMRIHISAPKPHCIRNDRNKDYYYYFDLSELEGIFHVFLTDGKIEKSARGDKCPFLFFRNKFEQEQFDEYFLKNEENIKRKEPKALWINADEVMKRHGYNYTINPISLMKIRQAYDNWKISN